ncbi:MAG: bifunctional riboflavin kinase/FAD synthetase [Balneolaceae bacterium]
MGKIIQLKDTVRNQNSVVTVGTFDGVHAGHRVLINTVLKKAEQRNARSVIVTFDPHPREIINPGQQGIKLLTSLEERCEILKDLGLDEMIVIPFTRDFSLLNSDEFIRDIIWKKIGVSEFVIGYDHQFGKDREGSIDTIKSFASELGFEVFVVSKQEIGDKTVSSTAIRKAIQEHGDMGLAAKLLERAYLLNGTVVHGSKRGKKIGYPTANIQPDHPNKIIPKNGVYAVKVRIIDQYYSGMMNIGVRPTFGEIRQTLEVHIFDFNRNIYGNSIQIRFIKRIRDEKQFDGIEDLKKQLARDKTECLKTLQKV